MKITFLKINGYKNLKTKAIFDDLGSCENYLAFIGLNGTGKSNVLEAIAKIFASLYSSSDAGFLYEIQYILKGNEIIAVNGVLTVDGKVIKKGKIREYLPLQVIACYSGEELRLWEDVFESFYISYFKRVLGREPDASPDMLYLNKYAWNLALIALMCSDKQSAKDFLKEVMNIVVDATITIDFTFDLSKYPSYKKNNDVLDLVKRINPLPYKEEINYNIITLSTLNIGAINNADFVKRVFMYLYIASMPKKNEKLKVDKIITEVKINFNELDIKSLSEGEKKLLLIKAIMEILGNEDCLLLFDEPDSHLHVSRKKEIKNYLDKPDHFAVLTTHSPTLVNCLKGENIRIVNNGTDGLEVIPFDKIKAIEELSDGTISLTDVTLAIFSTKDILLVEGPSDCKYIIKALDTLKQTKAHTYGNLDISVFNCGGAGNVAPVLEQLIPYIKSKQVVIAAFDNDNAGKDGESNVKDVLKRRPMANVATMLLPKITDWSGVEFLIEDYFPVSAYKPEILSRVNTASSFGGLSGIQKPKKIIEAKYETFLPSDFDNFGLLFDEIIKKQKSIRSILS